MTMQLSESALNYLQSLEQNSKALQKTSKKVTEKKVTSSQARRPSLVELMRRVPSFPNEDSDDDDLNASFKSSIFNDNSDASGREKVVFDVDDDNDDESFSRLPKGFPGSQVGRKSIAQIRELRNSIDASLIKPPMIEKRPGRSIKKEPSVEVVEEIEEKQPKAVFPMKSPFKNNVESASSDADSIVFDEVREDLDNSFKSSKSSVRFAPEIDEEKARKSTTKKATTSFSEASSSSEEDSNSSGQSDSESSDDTETVKDEDGSPSKHSSESDSSKESSSENTGSDSFVDDDEDDEEGSSKSAPVAAGKQKISSSSSTSCVKVPSEKLETPKIVSNTKMELGRVSSQAVDQRTPVQANRQTQQDGILPFREQQKSPETKETSERSERGREGLEAPDGLASEARKTNKNKENDKIKNRKSKQKTKSPEPSSISSESLSGSENNRRRRQHRRSHSVDQSSLLHYFYPGRQRMVSEMLDVHLKLIREFNHAEWQALQQWKVRLRDLRTNYNGPTSEGLQRIVVQRLRDSRFLTA